MPPYPGPGDAEVLRLLAALRAQEPGALAEVFDTYGLFLFDYAHLLLRDQRWAADGVHASLTAAQEDAGSLPGPDLFRARLYALVRTECLDRLEDPAQWPATRHPAPELIPPVPDQARLERARTIVQKAVAALPGTEQETAHLTLRHGLGSVELAEVLHISDQDAADLTAQVHAELAGSLTEELDRPVTTDRLPMVLELLPFAQAPEDFGDRLLGEHAGRDAAGRLITGSEASGDHEPETAGDEVPLTAIDPTAILAGLAALPELDGVSADAPAGSGDPRRRERRLGGVRVRVLAGTVVGVVLGIALVSLFVPGSPDSVTGDDNGSMPPQAAAPVGGVPTGAQPVQPNAPQLSPNGGNATPGPHPSGSPSVAPSGKGSTQPGSPAKPGTTTGPGSTTTGGTNSGGTPATTSPAAQPAPAPAPPPPPPPANGSLLINNGCSHVAAPVRQTCYITVTAVGGSVNWSVSGVTSDRANISASGGGFLSSGQSASVAVTVTPTTACYIRGFGNGSVSFSPNGTAPVSYTCW